MSNSKIISKYNFKEQLKFLNNYITNILVNYSFSSNIKIERKEDNFFWIVNKNNKTKIVLFCWHEIINLNNLELLLFANEIRSMYVDTLRNLITNYLESHCKFSKTYDKYCELNAVGSTDLTSNYNIIVTSFSLSTHIVYNFNNYFYKFWNDTSGMIFDTNVYGNTFFINIKDSISYNPKLDNLYNHIKTKDHKSIFYLPPKNNCFLTNTKRMFLQTQLYWLVIKIYLYIDDFSIKNNNTFNNVIKSLQDLILQLLDKKFGEKNNSLLEKLKDKYNNLNKLKPNKSIPGNEYRKKINKIYVDKLKIIDSNHNNYKNFIDAKKDNPKKNKLILDLIESISTNNFYGNETYFCIGTIYHVVGYIQNLASFFMYKEYYIHSMIENLIDTFRYYDYIKSDYKKFILKS